MSDETNKLKDYLNYNLECYPNETELEDIMSTAIKQDAWESNKGYLFKRTENNEREKAFYEQWMKDNYPQAGINFGQGILQDLFIERLEMFGTKWHEQINNRDRYIVATVIQWLGTNVGMCFLSEALNKFNAKIVYNESKQLTNKSEIK